MVVRCDMIQTPLVDDGIGGPKQWEVAFRDRERGIYIYICYIAPSHLLRLQQLQQTTSYNKLPRRAQTLQLSVLPVLLLGDSLLEFFSEVYPLFSFSHQWCRAISFIPLYIYILFFFLSFHAPFLCLESATAGGQACGLDYYFIIPASIELFSASLDTSIYRAHLNTARPFFFLFTKIFSLSFHKK